VSHPFAVPPRAPVAAWTSGVRRLPHALSLIVMAGALCSCLAQGQPADGSGSGDAGAAGAAGSGGSSVGGSGGSAGAACGVTHLSGACNTCAQSQCCDELEQCAADPGCQSLMSCLALNGCWNEGGLYGCADQYCPSLYEQSAAGLSLVDTCLRVACASDC